MLEALWRGPERQQVWAEGWDQAGKSVITPSDFIFHRACFSTKKQRIGSSWSYTTPSTPPPALRWPLQERTGWVRPFPHNEREPGQKVSPEQWFSTVPGTPNCLES